MSKLRIYTRTGDHGETGLYGGQRVRKNHIRVAAYGQVDQTNAEIGMSIALLDKAIAGDGNSEGLNRLRVILTAIQHDLFTLGADLATPIEKRNGTLPVLTDINIHALETWIDEVEAQLTPLQAFILPGGGLLAAQLHRCRAHCRATERDCVTLAGEAAIGDNNLPYLNRLSDLLFVLARWAAKLENQKETIWDKTAGSGLV